MILEAEKRRVAEALKDAGCIKWGDFTFASGMKSSLKIDLEEIYNFPKLTQIILDCYKKMSDPRMFGLVSHVPKGPRLFAQALSQEWNLPHVYPDWTVEDDHDPEALVGEYRRRQRVHIIEDVFTTGGSSLRTARRLEANELKPVSVVSIVDRGQGATANLERIGISSKYIVSLLGLVAYYFQIRYFTKDQLFQQLLEMRISSRESNLIPQLLLPSLEDPESHHPEAYSNPLPQ